MIKYICIAYGNTHGQWQRWTFKDVDKLHGSLHTSHDICLASQYTSIDECQLTIFIDLASNRRAISGVSMLSCARKIAKSGSSPAR